MRELRRRMIQDMNLAGFTEGTQRSYINAIRQLAGHYMTSPDQLTEKQVQDYVFYLRDEKGVAKGTFISVVLPSDEVSLCHHVELRLAAVY